VTQLNNESHAYEFNLTTKNFDGEELNVTFSFQFMYRYESYNKECNLGSSYPIDFPQCQLYKEETKVEQVANEGSINIDSKVIDELLNDGQLLAD